MLSVLNRLYSHYAGRDQRPVFFDIDKTYPSLNRITEHFPIIKQEFEAALTKLDNLPQYHDLDPRQAEISNACEKKWSIFMLYLMGHQSDEAQQLCPTTCQLINDIPNLSQVFFSILEPGKSIPKHNGPYMGYLRYHLGIQVPQENSPQIIINDLPYTWSEGKAVFFDDSWPHEVKNKSDDYRAVLIIDVLRPMPFIPHMLNKFIIKVLAKYSYGRQLVKRSKKHTNDIKPLFQ